LRLAFYSGLKSAHKKQSLNGAAPEQAAKTLKTQEALLQELHALVWTLAYGKVSEMLGGLNEAIERHVPPGEEQQFVRRMIYLAVRVEINRLETWL